MLNCDLEIILMQQPKMISLFLIYITVMAVFHLQSSHTFFRYPHLTPLQLTFVSMYNYVAVEI